MAQNGCAKELTLLFIPLPLGLDVYILGKGIVYVDQVVLCAALSAQSSV